MRLHGKQQTDKAYESYLEEKQEAEKIRLKKRKTNRAK